MGLPGLCSTISCRMPRKIRSISVRIARLVMEVGKTRAFPSASAPGGAGKTLARSAASTSGGTPAVAWIIVRAGSGGAGPPGNDPAACAKSRRPRSEAAIAAVWSSRLASPSVPTSLPTAGAAVNSGCDCQSCIISEWWLWRGGPPMSYGGSEHMSSSSRGDQCAPQATAQDYVDGGGEIDRRGLPDSIPSAVGWHMIGAFSGPVKAYFYSPRDRTGVRVVRTPCLWNRQPFNNRSTLSVFYSNFAFNLYEGLRQGALQGLKVGSCA